LTTDPTLRHDPGFQALEQHYLPRLEKGWLMMDEATLHRQYTTADRYLVLWVGLYHELCQKVDELVLGRKGKTDEN